jgi:hypothetical protein
MEIVIIAIVGILIVFLLFRLLRAFIKWGIIIILIFLAVAYFTNPEKSFHLKNLKDTAKNLSLRKIKEKAVKIDDYKFFSLVKVKVDGEERIVGIGAFGKVWYFDDIKEKLENR